MILLSQYRNDLKGFWGVLKAPKKIIYKNDSIKFVQKLCSFVEKYLLFREFFTYIYLYFAVLLSIFWTRSTYMQSHE